MNALFVAWRPPQTDDTTGWRPVGRLEHIDGIYRFFYTAGARKPGFQPFPGMIALDQVYESEKLFPIFENRLLSANVVGKIPRDVADHGSVGLRANGDCVFVGGVLDVEH
jgi:hypothetical protein